MLMAHNASHPSARNTSKQIVNAYTMYSINVIPTVKS